jgi:hypothetical protein
MHRCTSSAAKEEAPIPWTRDPSGRPQSQQKSEFQRTTDRVTLAGGRKLSRRRYFRTPGLRKLASTIAYLLGELFPGTERWAFLIATLTA